MALCALLALSGGLRAEPAPLDTPAEIAEFANRVSAYAHASLLRWTIVAASYAEAQAKIADIVADLPSADRALAARLLPQEDRGQRTASAFVTAQIGSTDARSCSWQVWVSDPALPSADARAATVPLAPRDRLPVSPRATFRVGHFGLVQSKLYAFDETGPGAIRDLAAAPDADIPAPTGGQDDYVVLVTARKAAPFLEDVKSALAASPGERRQLGAQYALRGRLLGAARGIGANIEAVPPSMIADKPAAPTARNEPVSRDDELMETCVYALTPAR